MNKPLLHYFISPEKLAKLDLDELEALAADLQVEIYERRGVNENTYDFS